MSSRRNSVHDGADIMSPPTLNSNYVVVHILAQRAINNTMIYAMEIFKCASL